MNKLQQKNTTYLVPTNYYKQTFLKLTKPPQGEAHTFYGTIMAQSPGDHNSRGFKSTKNYTKNLFPRETIKARALTSWGLVTCRGLHVLGALFDLRRWWFWWATAGARPYATLIFDLSPNDFSTLALFARSSKKGRCAPASPLI